MTEKLHERKKIRLTRRSFLKANAVTAAALSLTACGAGGERAVLGNLPAVAPGEQAQAKVVPTVACSHNCAGRCIANAHVVDGQIVRYTEGTDFSDQIQYEQIRPCVVGRAYRQREYLDERLKKPLRRTGKRGEGKFEEISWEEALDEVAARLQEIKDQYGPTAVYNAAFSGGHGQFYSPSMIYRFFGYYGGQTITWGGASNYASQFASMYTYGKTAPGMDATDSEDLLNSKLILMWGWNPANTIWDGATPYYLSKAKENGTKIICIDPIYNDSAIAWADQWIPIRPSTDTALMLAMAQVIISENLYNQDFLERFTVGFEQFKAYVLGDSDGQPKTPAWQETITGVPAATAYRLAREYAGTKPAALYDGWAVGRTAYGEQAIRAAIALQAMTGNVGVHGGEASANHSWYPRVGGWPIPPNEMASVSRPVQWEAMLKGKAGGYPSDVKAMFCAFGNPLTQAENINKGVEVLNNLDFIVVLEHFMTPTARFADILLPVATHLERNDIYRCDGKGGHYVIFGNKAVEPPEECKTDYEICRELARRMGFEAEFTEGKDEEDWLRQFLANSEIPLPYEEFKRIGYYKIPRSEPRVAFWDQIHNGVPFDTPSGKIEIYSETLANNAFQEYDPNLPAIPPIPQWIDHWDSLSDPLAEKYPLLGYSPHMRWRTHSTHDNVPWLREQALDQDRIWIHPIDAAARSLKDGDKVYVYNDRGRMLHTVKVTQRIMPGVVTVWQGRWYTPENPGTVGSVDLRGHVSLLNRDQRSPAGASCYNTLLVEVEKA